MPKVFLLNYQLPHSRYVRAYLISLISAEIPRCASTGVPERRSSSYTCGFLGYLPRSFVRRQIYIDIRKINTRTIISLTMAVHHATHKHTVHALRTRVWVILKWSENRKTFDFELLEYFCPRLEVLKKANWYFSLSSSLPALISAIG